MRSEECRGRITRFFEHIRERFVRFFGDAHDWLDQHIIPIIHFVEGIKVIIDNPALDILTAIIPGRVDNAIVQGIRQNIDKVIAILKLEQQVLEQATFDDKIKVIADYLRGLDNEVRNAILAKLAAFITRTLHPNQPFSSVELDTLVQVAYNQIHHDKKPT